MVNCWYRLAIPAWDCPRKKSSRSLMHSLQPNLKAAAWVYQSPVPLWNRTEAVCGPLRTTDGARRFTSLCRPQPRYTTQLRREIALDLVTALPPTDRAFESMNAGRSTQRE